MNRYLDAFSRVSKRIARLRVIGLTLMLLAFLFFIFYSSKQHKEILMQDSVIVKKDSVLSVLKDSTIRRKSEEEELKTVVTEYIRFRNEHNADSTGKFYADTLEVYFKNLRNATKQQVINSDKHYWRAFPHEKFIPVDPIQIIPDSLNHKAFIGGKECAADQHCRDVMIELHFNSDQKINFIRAYFVH